jgi:hypothetical protein
MITTSQAGILSDDIRILKNHFLGFHNDFFDGFRRISTYPPYNIEEGNYHKGISDRTFQKSFRLHEHIKVNGAELKNGLLKVAYHRDIPEAEKPKVIEIKSKK